MPDRFFIDDLPVDAEERLEVSLVNPSFNVCIPFRECLRAKHNLVD